MQKRGSYSASLYKLRRLMSKVMIIGGGAAGMMAAIAAAYNGNDVTLFEKMKN